MCELKYAWPMPEWSFALVCARACVYCGYVSV